MWPYLRRWGCRVSFGTILQGHDSYWFLPSEFWHFLGVEGECGFSLSKHIRTQQTLRDSKQVDTSVKPQFGRLLLGLTGRNGLVNNTRTLNGKNSRRMPLQDYKLTKSSFRGLHMCSALLANNVSRASFIALNSIAEDEVIILATRWQHHLNFNEDHIFLHLHVVLLILHVLCWWVHNLDLNLLKYCVYKNLYAGT